jgi:hypothetical protein
MFPSAHHVHAEHRRRQIPLAPRHVRLRAHQRPRSPLLFGSEEDDLETERQFRRRQQPRQFQRHGYPRGIVVGPDAALAALGVIVSAKQDAAGVLGIASQADHVAGDTVPATQRDILLQSRLVAELSEALAQVEGRTSLACRSGGARADPPRQILRRSHRALDVEILKPRHAVRNGSGLCSRNCLASQPGQQSDEARPKDNEWQRVTLPPPLPAGAADSDTRLCVGHPCACRSLTVAP